MKQQELIAQLTSAGLECHACQNADGSGIVVTPHGARIMGVFTHPQADNAYFVNPELADPASASLFLAGEHILGGDRLWLAPQLGIFFTGRTIESQVVPLTIDPGAYQVQHKTAASIELCNRIHTPFFGLAGTFIDAQVSRSIRLIPSPLADFSDRLPQLAHVRYVGYEIATQFELLGAPRHDMPIGLWFLIQIAVTHWGGAGHVYVPTSGRATVTDYFDPTTPEYLRVTNDHVRFRLDAARQLKIGICKTDIAGRAAFLSNADAEGHGILIVRNFPHNPSGNYVDVPINLPASTQDAVQCYNDLAGPGGLGELEHHTPAVSLASGDPVIHDRHQTWIFSGRRSDLIAVAAKLLNLPADVFAL